MVDLPEYEDWIEKESEAMRELEDEIGRVNDKKFAKALSKISSIIGIKLASFDDLSLVSTVELSTHFSKIGERLSSEQDSARSYAVESLLYERKDLSFDSLIEFYNSLPPDRKDISGARSSIANIIVDNFEKKQSEILLEIIKKQNQDPKSLSYSMDWLK